MCDGTATRSQKQTVTIPSYKSSQKALPWENEGTLPFNITCTCPVFLSLAVQQTIQKLVTLKQQHFFVSQLRSLPVCPGQVFYSIWVGRGGLVGLSWQRGPHRAPSLGSWEDGPSSGSGWGPPTGGLSRRVALKLRLPEDESLPKTGSGSCRTQAWAGNGQPPLTLIPSKQGSLRVSPDSNTGNRDTTFNERNVKGFMTTFNSSKAPSFLHKNLVSHKCKQT